MTGRLIASGAALLAAIVFPLDQINRGAVEDVKHLSPRSSRLHGGSQNQAPVFRSGSEVVRLDVLVTERGKPITGLTAADFVVKDKRRRAEN